MRLKKTSQTTDLVLALFLYIPVVWAALLIAQSLGGGLPELLSNLTAALEQPFQIQWTDKSLLSILVCTGAYLMGLCLYASGQGRTRDGEEHGSAAWGSPRQLNAQFRQKQNKILTRHVRLGLDTHKHRRSLNVLVIGGSGAAKTLSLIHILTEKARERSSLAGVLSLYGILECLARLESRRFGSGNFNGGSSGRILAGAGGALLHLEGAKAQPLYLVTGLQRSCLLYTSHRPEICRYGTGNCLWDAYHNLASYFSPYESHAYGTGQC